MNTTINVIPKKERIEVYKRALEIIENEEDVYGLVEYPLCVLLRCIDSNVKHYVYSYKIVDDYHYTPKLYPEFGKYYENNVKNFLNVYAFNRNLWRRVVLRLILEKMGVDTIKLNE